MAHTDFKSVAEYIASRPASARPVLRRVRSILRKALPPGAAEIISYQIPAYRLPAGMVVFFAAWKDHYSLYPASDEMIAAIGADARRYRASKGTLRFPLSEPVPEKLLARVVRFRAREVAARARVKEGGKSSRRAP